MIALPEQVLPDIAAQLTTARNRTTAVQNAICPVISAAAICLIAKNRSRRMTMANEKRLIDANAAIERAKESDKIVKSSIWETGEVVEFLEDCPIVDAVEVVHRRWTYNPGNPSPYCSHCGNEPDNHGRETPYCPNCGAKMDGERKDNDR